MCLGTVNRLSLTGRVTPVLPGRYVTVGSLGRCLPRHHAAGRYVTVGSLGRGRHHAAGRYVTVGQTLSLGRPADTMLPPQVRDSHLVPCLAAWFSW